MTELAHSLSALQNIKFILLCFSLLSSRFIVVGLGNKFFLQLRVKFFGVVPEDVCSP